MAQAEQHWFGNRLIIGGSVIITSGASDTSALIFEEVGYVSKGSLYFQVTGSGGGFWVCTDEAGTWVLLTIA